MYMLKILRGPWACWREDTDELILKIINTDILKHSEQKLTLEHIGRSHRLGKRKPGVPRNIIVRFSIYRYRALVYRNKSYLKERNDIPGNISKIYVNEALTTKRVNLFKQTRKLYNDKLIKNCWTSDGRIFVCNKEDTQTVLISTESDLSQFFNIRIQILMVTCQSSIPRNKILQVLLMPVLLSSDLVVSHQPQQPETVTVQDPDNPQKVTKCSSISFKI